MPEKNEIYTVEIEGMTSEGHGVCRINGRAVFVPYTIVGETWEIKILKVSKTAVYGKGITNVSPSSHRQDANCPVFQKCGGCSLMHMSYEKELEFKLGKVNDAIARIGKLDFKIEGILGATDRFNYRNKAIYAVGDGVTGFYRSRTHEIIPVEKCAIQSPIADKAAAVLRKFMGEHNIPVYNEKTGKGSVRHIFVRTSVKNKNAVICIVSARGFGGLTEALVTEMRNACPEASGIVLNVNKSQGNTVLSGEFFTLWGSEVLSDDLCGNSFDLSPKAFFQINPPQAERLYEKTLEYANPEGETVLDLYCGAGTISLCLASKAKKVIGAEIVPEAIENARINAEKNSIKNVEFICADASEASETFLKSGINPDTVVVDPPRKGLAPDVIEAICTMKPKKVVYVSCNPATLARDMAIFAEKAYLPKMGVAVDMFPCTDHVECTTLMTYCGDKAKN